MKRYVPFCEVGAMSSVVYHEGRVYATHGKANLDNNVMGRLVCVWLPGQLGVVVSRARAHCIASGCLGGG